MKVEIIDDGIRFFVQNIYFKDIDWDQKDEVVEKIKNLFLKIKKRYHLLIRGLYKVKVYPHKVGVIIEAILLDEENYMNVDIDLRIVVLFQKEIYLKIDDYSFVEELNLPYYYKDSYYINLDDIKDISKCIEFGTIVTDNIDDNLF